MWHCEIVVCVGTDLVVQFGVHGAGGLGGKEISCQRYRCQVIACLFLFTFLCSPLPVTETVPCFTLFLILIDTHIVRL